ncbi:hypothetical protein VCA_002526 [Vibrio albensis VL426]|nr:hypothetical protein VCA_002526 [Vibrio cholerae VL426]
MIHRDKKQRCGAAFFISAFCPFPLLDDGSPKQSQKGAIKILCRIS